MVDIKRMNYDDFKLLAEKIRECLKIYEKLNKNNYGEGTVIFLSDGSRINVAIPEGSVAHLLGIKTEYLKISGCFSEKSSYLLLKKLAFDTNNFYEKLCSGNVLFSSFISEFVDDKIRIFFNQLKMMLDNIEFVCKYNNSLSWISGEEQKSVDYVIVCRYRDYLTLLGLKNVADVCIPVTSQYIDLNTEHGKKVLAAFIRNQTLTVPEALMVPNKFRRNAYDEELIAKLKNIENRYSEFDVVIDVSNLCKHLLNNSINSRNIVKSVSNALITGDCIEFIDSFLSSDLQKLIKSCNWALSNSDSRDEQIFELEKYKALLIEVEQLREINQKLLVDNNSLSLENETLRSDNSNLSTRLVKIRELCN